MLKSLLDIGRHLHNCEYEKPFLTKDNKTYVIAINITDTYKIELVGYDINNYHIYGYKRKSSNGPHYGPGAVMNKPYLQEKKGVTKLEKTFVSRITSWLKHASNINDDFKKTYQMIVDNHDDMISQLISMISPANRYYITLKFNGLFPGEDKKISQMIKDFVLDNKAKDSGKGICSMCKQDTLVYGNASPYTIFSRDRKCYLSGFDDKNSYKNFPVCGDCYLAMLRGREYVKDKLSFKLAGHKFLLYPECHHNPEFNMKYLETIYDTNEGGIKELNSDKTTSVKKKEDTMEKWRDMQLLSKLTTLKDFFYYKMLFYDFNNSRLMPLLFLTDIYPSRINRIAEASKKASIDNYKFDFWMIQKLCSDLMLRYNRVSTKNVINAERSMCLSITECIFKETHIDEKVIFDLIHQRLIECFKISMYKNSNEKAYSFYNISKLSLVVLRFLKEVGVLGSQTVTSLTTELLKRNVMAEKVEEFFNSNGSIFTSNAAKACLLAGVLVSKVTKRQSETHKASFFDKLKGFQLDRRDVGNLINQSVNKWSEYDKDDYFWRYNNEFRLLNELASYYYGMAGEKWEIREIGTLVALGVGLYYLDPFYYRKKNGGTIDETNKK